MSLSFANRLALGSANFGASYGFLRNADLSDKVFSHSVGLHILEQAWDLGIKWVDTARNYGESEKIIGEFCRSDSERKFSVVTKFLAKQWKDSLSMSAEILGSSLGVGMVHNYDEQSADCVALLKSLGDLQKNFPNIALGASSYGIRNPIAAVNSGAFKTLEIEFSLMNPLVLNEVKTLAEKNGVRLMLRSVLMRGFLTEQGVLSIQQAHKTPTVNKKLLHSRKRLHSMAQSCELTLEQLAILYSLQVSGDSLVIVAVHEGKQLKQNLLPLVDRCLNESCLKEIESIASELDPKDVDLRSWIS